MRRWSGLLVLTTVLGQAVSNGGRVLLPWRVLDFGGSAATVGWLTTAFSFVPLIIALPAGKLVDSHRAIEVVHSGLAATVIAVAVMAFSPNLPTLLLGYMALGLVHVTTPIVAQGMVPHLRGGVAGPDSLFVYLTPGIFVRQFPGIVDAGLLAPSHGDSAMTTTTSALWAMTGIGAIALVIGWSVVTAYRRHGANAVAEVQATSSTAYSRVSTVSDHSRMEERRPTRAEASGASVLGILRIDGMSSAMVVSVAVIVAIDLLTVYMPVLGRELGFSVAEVTVIPSVRSNLAIIFRALMPTILRKANRNRVFIITVCVGVLSLLVMPWLQSAWLMVITVGIYGLAWGLVMPMSMTWVSSLVDAEARAQALSVWLVGNRLVQVILPPVAGLGATAMGAGSVFLGAGALMGVASTMVWRRLAGDKATLTR